MNSKLPGWGPWRLDVEACVLYLTDPVYDIELTRCTTKESILGWIAHMASKTWMDDAHLAGLVRAMNDLFNPHFSSTEFPKTEQRIRAIVRGVACEDEIRPFVCPMPVETGDLP